MTYRPNPRFHAEMRAQPEFQAGLRAVAEAIKQRAEELAPPGRDLARRFVVVIENGQVRVGNTDPFMHLAEWGSVNNPPYAPLRRAVTAAGFELVEAPKH